MYYKVSLFILIYWLVNKKFFEINTIYIFGALTYSKIKEIPFIKILCVNKPCLLLVYRWCTIVYDFAERTLLLGSIVSYISNFFRKTYALSIINFHYILTMGKHFKSFFNFLTIFESCHLIAQIGVFNNFPIHAQINIRWLFHSLLCHSKLNPRFCNECS